MYDRAELIGLVRRAGPHLTPPGPSTEEWMNRLDERHDALHVLIEGLLVSDSHIALELAGILWPYWWQRDHMVEGRELLQRAAAIDAPGRAEVLRGLGTIAFRQGDTQAAERAFKARLEMVEEGGTPLELASALSDLCRVALRRGDFASVRVYAERGRAAGRDNPQAIRIPLHMLAAAARMEGRLEEARTLYLESRDLNERLGNALMVAAEDHNMFHVALSSGDRDEAERRFRTSSEWIFANDNAYLRPYAILDAGILALHDGDLPRAGRLVASAQRIFQDSASIPDPDDHAELDRAIARLRAGLGEQFDAVWTEGRALTLDRAQALARG